MIEIIPNWHPLIVHFPIALIVVSLITYICATLFNSLSEELYITSKWSLWFAALSSILAATLGWFAYNSVEHDAISHGAMTLHRNWGIPSAVVVVVSALWCFKLRHYWGRRHKAISIFLLVTSSILISITGFLGGETVYRHGIGVLRIPDKGEHDHKEGHKHAHKGETNKTEHLTLKKEKNKKTKKINKKGHYHHDGEHHEH